jgi:GNAT superfamily N-acetyltransferase
MTRWAVPEDANDLADVHVTTWQRAYRGILEDGFLQDLDRQRRAAWWRRFIEDGARVHVVGERPVVGFCHAGASDDEGWGEIFSLYVLPEKWGTGLGLELIGAGEGTIREGGFTRGLLWVLESNVRARAFYERQGWRLGKPIRLEEIGGAQVTEVRYEKSLAGPLPPDPSHSGRSL